MVSDSFRRFPTEICRILPTSDGFRRFSTEVGRILPTSNDFRWFPAVSVGSVAQWEGSYPLPAVSAGSNGNRSNIVGFFNGFERPTNGNRRKHTFIVLYTNYFMPTTPTYYSHTLFLPNTLYILYSLPTDPYPVVSTQKIFTVVKKTLLNLVKKCFKTFIEKFLPLAKLTEIGVTSNFFQKKSLC